MSQDIIQRLLEREEEVVPHFRIDMPRYIDFYMQGRLMLDEMITRTGTLEDVNEAFRAMKAGEVRR